LGHANEPLRIEQQPAAQPEPLERGRVEVAAQQRSDVKPLDAAEEHSLRLVRAPRLADRIDGHRARAVGVVREREARRLAAGCKRRGQPESGEPSLEARAVVVAALREEHRLLSEQMERAAGIPRRTAETGSGAGDDVAREVSDDCERPHGREIYAGACLGRRARATAVTPVASTKETAKLGREAPMPPLAGWSSESQRDQKPSPWVCAIHS
jgi:hypothetical protein